MPANLYDENELAKLVKGVRKMSEVIDRIKKALKKDPYFRDRPKASFANTKRALKDRGLLEGIEKDTSGLIATWPVKTKREFKKACKTYREDPDATVEGIRKKFKLRDEIHVRNIAATFSESLARKLKKADTKRGPTKKVIQEEEWLEFFSGSKTIKETMEHFDIPSTVAKGRLKQSIKSHKLYQHNSLFGERLFVYLPISEKTEVIKPKIWSYLKEKTGKPGVAINFPDDIGWHEKKGSKKKKKEKMRIVPISDVWLQFPSPHPLHDEVNFDERINWIKREKHVFAILNGDILYPRNYGPIKIRGDEFSQVVDRLREKFAPIAHKILWAQAGCFEEKHAKLVGLFDPIKYLCEEWNIPYFETPCYNVISWKKNLFYFFCIHGKSTAQKHGAKLNAVVRPLAFNDFTHFFVMSHIRDNKTRKVRRVRKKPGGAGLTLEKQYAVICPSFVTYDKSREAKWGYIPPSRGQLSLVLYASGDYHVYASPQQEFEEILF